MSPEKSISRRFTLSYAVRSNEPTVSMLIPGVVQCLTIQKNPTVPSVYFRWEPPINVIEQREQVLRYEIKVTPLSLSSSTTTWSNHYGSENQIRDLIEVDGKETMVELSMAKHGLRPLRGYVFSVRATSSRFSTGEWNDVEGFLGEFLENIIMGLLLPLCGRVVGGVNHC